ncbi:MAG: hypothetical protein IKT68_03150 [Clostridia bacterium]|nr:hypothetical protein [Clostridia bacterium]
MNEGMGRFAARVTARKLNRRKMFLRVAIVVALIAVTLLALFYGLSVFVNKAGNFTVMVPEEFAGSLSLCNTADFSKPTTVIQADVVPEMTNITKAWLPENLHEVDGAHNGEDYIAHTFYVKNIGVDEIDYQAEIIIESAALGADEAVRVMIIRNGVETVYAKPQKGSTQPEPDATKNFASASRVMSEPIGGFAPGKTDKYTVVIWLEGNDPECVDDIKGGEVKMSMNLRVTGTKTPV